MAHSVSAFLPPRSALAAGLRRLFGRRDPLFERFLDGYPGARQGAGRHSRAAWEALCADEKRAAVEALPAWLEARSSRRRRHSATSYLRGKPWRLLTSEAAG